MSRDKQTQIEGITDVLDECTYDNELKDQMALKLYNAGYRKSTELAEEIFAEIEKCFFEELVGCTEAKLIDEERFAEFKKKYAVTDTNVGCKTEEGK